jgi:hypothetical protein
MKNRHLNIKLFLVAAVAFSMLALNGCQLEYLLAGNGISESVYHIKRKDRVLVLVDSSSVSPLSIHAMSQLIAATNQNLYRNGVTKRLVPAYRLISLMKTHPVSYREMGIADIAKALNANIVLYIYIERFRNRLLSAKQITEGDAQAYVKLVSESGQRLWPKSAAPGELVTVKVPPNLAMTQTHTAVEDSLLAQIANRTASFLYTHGKSYAPSHGAQMTGPPSS